MSTYRFTPALDYTFAHLSEMHNISFTGYFFPSNMTPESTASMYRIYQVAPQHCIAMHTEDGTFVGFAKLALRGPVTLDRLISSIIERRQPDWEHELSSILATNNQTLMTTGPYSTPAGIVFQRTDDYMRVLSSTPSANTTTEEMAALLAAAANGVPTIQVYNEPEGSISFNLYNALGFQEFFRQYEMLLHLL